MRSAGADLKNLELDLLFNFVDLANQSTIDSFNYFCENFWIWSFEIVSIFISQNYVFIEL